MNAVAFPRKTINQSKFASQHGVGLSTLSKWLRSEREAVPPKIKFQEVRLPNPAARGPFEVINPQGWIVRVPHGLDAQLLPELLRALPRRH